jgi:hypothetical protein
LLAAGPGRCRQVRDPLLVAAPLGSLRFQLRFGRVEAGQPPGRAGQFGRELIAPGGAVLAVLGLVGLGRLAQDRRDLVVELGQGAVGPVGGVGGHLGAVQRDQAQADQPGRRAQLQRGDEEPGKRLFVAGAEPRDGHVVGELVAGQDTKGEVLAAVPLDLPGGAHPDGVGVQQHAKQGLGVVGGWPCPSAP